MTDLSALIAARDAARAECDAKWDAADVAWDKLQDLNKRVAIGTELANAPGGEHLKPLLRERKFERDEADEVYQAALARWKLAEEIYTFAVNNARAFGAPEEEAR